MPVRLTGHRVCSGLPREVCRPILMQSSVEARMRCISTLPIGRSTPWRSYRRAGGCLRPYKQVLSRLVKGSPVQPSSARAIGSVPTRFAARGR
jgi:hypothetical protein